MATRSIIYYLSVQGAGQVKAELDQVQQRFTEGTASIGDLRDAQLKATQVARVYNNEQRIQGQLFLAMHPNVRKVSEAMGTLSRATSAALTAVNAINLAQIAFNQSTTAQTEAVINLKQAERELALGIRQGGSDEQLANLRENAELAKVKLKELNEQTSQQRLQNLFTFGTAIAHLGSSFGSIVTKSPEILNLFRRLGGVFGGGSPVTGGGPPPPSGTGSYSRGFGGFPPPSIVPGAGGQCLEICSKSQAGIATTVGEKVSTGLRWLIPYLLPIGAVAGGIAIWEAIRDKIPVPPFDVSVLNWPKLPDKTKTEVTNWPQWLLHPPQPAVTRTPEEEQAFGQNPFTPGSVESKEWDKIAKQLRDAVNEREKDNFSQMEEIMRKSGMMPHATVPLYTEPATAGPGKQPVESTAFERALAKYFGGIAAIPNILSGKNVVQSGAQIAPSLPKQSQAPNENKAPDNDAQTIASAMVGGLAGWLIQNLVKPLQQFGNITKGVGAFKLPNIESFGLDHFGPPPAEATSAPVPPLTSRFKATDSPRIPQATSSVIVKQNSEDTAKKSADIKNIWDKIFFQNQSATTSVSATATRIVQTSDQFSADYGKGTKATSNVVMSGAAALATSFAGGVNNIVTILQKAISRAQAIASSSSSSGSKSSSSSGSTGGPVTYKGLSGAAAVAAKAAGFAEGGTINEPTMLLGLKSGGVGLMAEKGPERIVPEDRMRPRPSAPSRGSGTVVIINHYNTFQGSLWTTDQLHKEMDKRTARDLRQYGGHGQ